MCAKPYKKKHPVLRRMLLLVLFFLFLAAFWFVNTFVPFPHKVTVESEKISKPVTLVQLSDLHGASFGPDNSYLKWLIRQAKPDAIVATGDLFTHGDEAGKKVAIKLLSDLAKEYSVYMVPGEHDNNKTYLQSLQDAGVQVLTYEQEDVELNDNPITFYGIDNAYYSPTFDLHREFTPDEDHYNILLAHIPSVSALDPFGADLTLCGDTHGGMVQIPFLGPLYLDGVWLPELSAPKTQVYDKGLFQLKNTQMYISNGLARQPVPLRLFNLPEIAVINLTPKN